MATERSPTAVSGSCCTFHHAFGSASWLEDIAVDPSVDINLQVPTVSTKFSSSTLDVRAPWSPSLNCKSHMSGYFFVSDETFLFIIDIEKREFQPIKVALLLSIDDVFLSFSKTRFNVFTFISASFFFKCVFFRWTWRTASGRAVCATKVNVKMKRRSWMLEVFKRWKWEGSRLRPHCSSLMLFCMFYFLYYFHVCICFVLIAASKYVFSILDVNWIALNGSREKTLIWSSLEKRNLNHIA